MPPLLLRVFRQPRSERIKRRIRTREGADICTAIRSCLMESIVRDIAHCLLRYNYVYSIVVVIYYNVFSLFTISFVDFDLTIVFFFRNDRSKIAKKVKISILCIFLNFD